MENVPRSEPRHVVWGDAVIAPKALPAESLKVFGSAPSINTPNTGYV